MDMKVFLLCCSYVFFFLNTLYFDNDVIQKFNMVQNEQVIVKAILEKWCKENYDSCFNWDFVDIEYISEILHPHKSKIVVKGGVRNKGFFGKIYNRPFKASLLYINESCLEVTFEKIERFQYAEDKWVRCTRVVYIDN